MGHSVALCVASQVKRLEAQLHSRELRRSSSPFSSRARNERGCATMYSMETWSEATSRHLHMVMDDADASLALALELQRQCDLEAARETAVAWATTAAVAAAADAEDAAAAAWQEAGIVLSQEIATEEEDNEWEEVLAAVAAAETAQVAAEAEAARPARPAPARPPQRAIAGGEATSWEHGSLLEDTGSTFQVKQKLDACVREPPPLLGLRGRFQKPWLAFAITTYCPTATHLHAISGAQHLLPHRRTSTQSPTPPT